MDLILVLAIEKETKFLAQLILEKVIVEEGEITPLARINLGQTLFDSYTESGTNGLSFEEQKVYTGSASLGLEARNNIKFIGGELEPFGVFEYELDLVNPQESK